MRRTVTWSYVAGCQLDYLVFVVIIGGFVPLQRTAFAAFVGDDETLFCIGFSGDGIHDAVTFRRTVTGIDIKMKGAQTYGAVIA